ncbi:uncharacterized protein BDW70DRAFT_153891 [Aspergillus foveolatus]|uniref:uncharacterized protein n=1 Tax=Aspergillus foveolatus TaxID=210207 RepID=UPI003CCCED6B
MQVSVVSGQDAIAINLHAHYEQRLRLDTIYPFQSDEKQAAAVYKTEPFTLRDMVSSAENGCRGCRFLAALLAGVGSVYAYTELELAGMAFKWLGSSFLLEMTAEDGRKRSSGGCFSESIPDSCLLIQDPGWPAVYLGGQGTIVQGPLPALHASVGFQVGCQGGLSCECGGGSIAPHFKPVPTVMNVAKLKTLSELKPDEGGGGLVGDDFTMLIYRNWVDIVVSYAKLDITVPSDRLPAISATAKIVSRNMKSEYLAGIWRATLMEGLLCDCTLYTVEADGPLNQVWTRCTFAEPALDLLDMGSSNVLARGHAGLRHVIYFMFLERDALR